MTEPGLPAVVLRTTPYGESDLVVQLFVRGRGRTGAFARAARASKRRFAGGLEPFSLLDVELGDRRGRDLAELRGATLVDAHLALRQDLHRLAHAGYATELCRELLRDDEPNDALFDLIAAFYAHLAGAGARSLVLRAF